MRVRGAVVLVVVSLAVGWALHAQQKPAATDASRAPVTKEMWDGWMKNENNWGRWGKEDQRGALNLITAAKQKHAISLAKTGTVVSLAHAPSLVPKVPD